MPPMVWKYVETTGIGGSPFSFTTDYSLLFGGSPVLADVIQYFVVAQDNQVHLMSVLRVVHLLPLQPA